MPGRGIYAGTFRDGLIESVCAFELEDEDAAFAYAESLVAQRAGPTECGEPCHRSGGRCFRSTAGARTAKPRPTFYAERMTYDDRRSLAGVPDGQPE